MPWAAAASAVGGAAASIFGAKDNKVDVPSAEEQMQAAIRVNNPNYNSFWGGTRVTIDPGASDKPGDDTYTLTQRMSPEMQALSDALAGRAGASRGTFSSGGMPTGFQDQFQSALGYAPATASYDRPQFGFGLGEGPVELPESYTQGVEGMSNEQALAWALENTDLSGQSADFVGGMFANNPDWGDSNALVTGSWDPEYSGLNQRNRGLVNEFIETIAPMAGERVDPVTPNISGKTNAEALAWIDHFGGFDDKQAKVANKFLAKHGLEGGNSLVTGAFDPTQYNMNGKQSEAIEALLAALAPVSYGRTNMPLPPGPTYDPTQPSSIIEGDAMNDLINALV